MDEYGSHEDLKESCISIELMEQKGNVTGPIDSNGLEKGGEKRGGGEREGGGRQKGRQTETERVRGGERHKERARIQNRFMFI